MIKATLFALLALSSTTVQACAHHDNHEVAPPHVREELLKKWDQEVRLFLRPSRASDIYRQLMMTTMTTVVIHRNLDLRALETSQVSN